MPIVTTKEPTHNLSAQWTRAGEDLLVLVTGGDGPHIGAVAMAAPRPSLEDETKNSATTSVFCFLGHKEDELARQMAQALATALGVRVVVAAGAHWDGLDAEGIGRVRANAEILLQALLQALGEGRP